MTACPIPRARTTLPFLAKSAGLALAAGLLLTRAASALAGPTLPPPSAFPRPPGLRPCCAFGYRYRVEIGSVPMPFALGNVVSVEKLGRHGYPNGSIATEHNGLAYTCRGGFIDLSHVRDNADRVAYLAVRIRVLLEGGGELDLPPEGGRLKLSIKAARAGADRDELALALARRIAYELSVWHELATWFGHRSVAHFPEQISGFSPEDLYSNLVGVEVGARALRRMKRSGRPFAPLVDEEIQAALGDLSPVGVRETGRAFDAVDGIWWDSSLAVPDTFMVTRRHMDFSWYVRPWILPPERFPACGAAPRVPEVFRVPEAGPSGTWLVEAYDLEIVLDRGDVPDVCLPAPGVERIGPQDFPKMASYVRRQVRRKFGTSADRPFDVPPSPLQDRPIPDGMPPPHPGPVVGCGLHDPDCAEARRRSLGGLRILELDLRGAVSHAGGLQGQGGATVRGLSADTPGGDLELMRVSLHGDPGRRGVIFGWTLARSEALYPCSDAETDASHGPLVAWFRPCRPGGVLGLGGTLARLQLDARSGRLGIRPVEAHAAINLLGNAFSPGYLKGRLVLTAGAGLDLMLRQGDLVQGDPNQVLPYAEARLLGLVRSSDLRWEARAGALYRHPLDGGDPRAVEGVLGFLVHLVPTTERELPADRLLGPGARRREPWGLVSLGIEGSYGWWSLPASSLSTLAGPFLSDRRSTTWQVQVRVRIASESFIF